MVRFIISSICVSAAIAARSAVFDFGLQGVAGSGLLPGNEQPVPVTDSSGSGSVSGTIQYNNSNNQLTFTIPFQNLTSAAQTAAIRGPAGQTAVAPSVLYDLTGGFLTFDPSVTDGTKGTLQSPGIGGTVTLVANPNGTSNYSIAQQEADLSSGLWYIEITTANHNFGEIRGNLVPVPEPQTYAALSGIGLLGFALFRKVRSARSTEP